MVGFLADAPCRGKAGYHDLHHTQHTRLRSTNIQAAIRDQDTIVSSRSLQ